MELSVSPQPKERRCHSLFLDTLISTEGEASTEHMKPAGTSTVSADLCQNFSQPDCLIFFGSHFLQIKKNYPRGMAMDQNAEDHFKASVIAHN